MSKRKRMGNREESTVMLDDNIKIYSEKWNMLNTIIN